MKVRLEEAKTAIAFLVVLQEKMENLTPSVELPAASFGFKDASWVVGMR